jgi:hypothetical protein
VASKKLLGKVLEKEKEFIMFFEPRVDRHIESTLKQIREHLRTDTPLST